MVKLLSGACHRYPEVMHWCNVDLWQRYKAEFATMASHERNARNGNCSNARIRRISQAVTPDRRRRATVKGLMTMSHQ